MLWLQDNDEFDKLVELDLTTGLHRIHSRSTLGPQSPTKTDGVFAMLASVLVALYKHGSELFVRVGNTTVRLEKDVIIRASGSPPQRTLSVFKSGKEVARLQYAIDSSLNISGDPTPFIDNEDFDFGLFVSNISLAPERQEVLLGLS